MLLLVLLHRGSVCYYTGGQCATTQGVSVLLHRGSVCYYTGGQCAATQGVSVLLHRGSVCLLLWHLMRVATSATTQGVSVLTSVALDACCY